MISCGCESSFCDHDGPCGREASEYVAMEYVLDTCDTCAANMCASGGESYIYLLPPYRGRTVAETMMKKETR